MRDGRLVTNGGRILSVTARGSNVAAAREAAYAAVSMVEFEGARHRDDIAGMVDG
jgi:phosphoribosylamine--glycine ligase